jgi:hypothetical protein
MLEAEWGERQHSPPMLELRKLQLFAQTFNTKGERQVFKNADIYSFDKSTTASDGVSMVLSSSSAFTICWVFGTNGSK